MGCSFSGEVRDHPAYVVRDRQAELPPPQQYSVQCSLCQTSFQVAVPLGIAQRSHVEAPCPYCRQPVRFGVGAHTRRARSRRATGGPHDAYGGVLDWGPLGHDRALLEDALNERVLQEAIEQSKKAHLLSGLPREKYNRERHGNLVECELCLEDYMAGDELMRLPCMHFFHSHCVSPWLQRAYTCPVCQTDANQAILAN